MLACIKSRPKISPARRKVVGLIRRCFVYKDVRAERSPSLTPKIRCCGDHDRDLHGGHRSHHCCHCHAPDCRPARRIHVFQLGVFRFPAGAVDHNGDLRPARRHLRAQADPGQRHRPVRDRLPAVRLRLVDGVADRLPPAARDRRRCDPAGDDDDHRRSLQARGTRPRAGHDGQRMGDVGRARTARGRADRRQCRLGLDLLDQHPDRHRGRDRHPPLSA